MACGGNAIMVPAGTWHNVTNTGNIPLKIYAIYAPPDGNTGLTMVIVKPNGVGRGYEVVKTISLDEYKKRSIQNGDIHHS
jgi:oxalate decarboxylase/phosphoglucose isomerase-like protein (cupin superfamily)